MSAKYCTIAFVYFRSCGSVCAISRRSSEYAGLRGGGGLPVSILLGLLLLPRLLLPRRCCFKIFTWPVPIVYFF